jgi:hypothetical protein
VSHINSEELKFCREIVNIFSDSLQVGIFPRRTAFMGHH